MVITKLINLCISIIAQFSSNQRLVRAAFFFLSQRENELFSLNGLFLAHNKNTHINLYLVCLIFSIPIFIGNKQNYFDTMFNNNVVVFFHFLWFASKIGKYSEQKLRIIMTLHTHKTKEKTQIPSKEMLWSSLNENCFWATYRSRWMSCVCWIHVSFQRVFRINP